MPAAEEWVAKGLEKYGLIAVNETNEAAQVGGRGVVVVAFVVTYTTTTTTTTTVITTTTTTTTTVITTITTTTGGKSLTCHRSGAVSNLWESEAGGSVIGIIFCID